MITPDHTIRTKNWPLIVPAPEAGKLDDFSARPRAAAAAFVERYRAYFARNNARAGGGKTMLDPLPRVVLVPGLGLFGLGRSAKDARIAADLAEAAVEAITDAEAIGRFSPIGEADMFDCEYWSLEQAKLGRRRRCRSPARSPSITGAGGAIGAATAKAFAAAGAEVALLDVDLAAAAEKAKAIGGAALAHRLRRHRRSIGARGLRRRSSKPSAASTSSCRMPARPGRAASARSTRRLCARASS